MKRRPQDLTKPAITLSNSNGTNGANPNPNIGLILSGGGSRAAYQVGALKALVDFIQRSGSKISVVVGSSIGAVNGIAFSACLKQGLAPAVAELESLWLERTFRNTFKGSPSKSFLKAIKMAYVRYSKDPRPHATSDAIFDPTPLMDRVDSVLKKYGGVNPNSWDKNLNAVAVMTTVEGAERKPLLFLASSNGMSEKDLEGASFRVHRVNELTAKHGLASAALPSVLPPVDLDVEGGRVSLVDGGISQNIPVDPAVRLGADRAIVIDISGRDWWFNRYGEAHDKRPDWEVAAGLKTYCVRPPETFIVRCKKPLGPILKQTAASSTRHFITALGPTWPVFTLLKKKFGEEVAYEAMTYAALHPEFTQGLIERGYDETMDILKKTDHLDFKRSGSYEELYASL